VRLEALAAGRDPVEQGLALGDRRPVVERAHGDQRRLWHGEPGAERLGQAPSG
jgi:hypothetical protein